METHITMLAGVDAGFWLKAVGQFFLVTLCCFVAFTLLVSHLRYRLLQEGAHRGDASELGPREAFRLKGAAHLKAAG